MNTRVAPAASLPVVTRLVPTVAFVVVVLLVATAGAARAQGYSARVVEHAPGQVWTLGTGAGDPWNGGYGARPDFRLPGNARAVLFGNGKFLDVTPADREGAIINDSEGRRHGGGACAEGRYPGFAYLWNDDVAVSLHPEGWVVSEVLGVGGDVEAGYVDGSSFCAECGRLVTRHAAAWNGSAGSLRLLHARDHDLAVALDTDGRQLVGHGRRIDQDGAEHALLWDGAAGAAIDLHPAGAFEQSAAADVAGGTQVGSAFGAASGFQLHAARWTGTAESFVDLNPEGYARSNAKAVRKGVVVGEGSTDAEAWRYRALAWTDGAASFVDLHAALPVEFQSWNSTAEAIDERGNIVGSIEKDGDLRPVTWSPLGGDAPVAASVAGDMPVVFSLGQAVPNPTRSSVNFRVGLPQASTVEVAFYDVRGARVRGEAKRLDAGWQTWAWSGTDDAGQSVASGVYFARMTVEGREVGRHKVVVTR